MQKNDHSILKMKDTLREIAQGVNYIYNYLKRLNNAGFLSARLKPAPLPSLNPVFNLGFLSGSGHTADHRSHCSHNYHDPGTGSHAAEDQTS